MTKICLDKWGHYTQAVIRPNAPTLPINALIVTSRDKNSLQNATPFLLKTGLLKGQGIAAFIEDYIQQNNKRTQFTDAEFYEELNRFTRLVNGKEITALLAGLYARHIMDRKDNNTVERPQNIPELMDAYVAEMCRKVNDKTYSIQTVHPLVRKIAWHCLKNTLTPTEMPLADLVAALLQTEDGISLPVGQTDPNTVITFFVEKLRLLQWHGSDNSHVKFTLDPLSEYLAARYLVVHDYRDNQSQWMEFFEETKEHFKPLQSIAGFIRALDDTLETKGQDGHVPAPVLKAMRRRFKPALSGTVLRIIPAQPASDLPVTVVSNTIQQPV